MTDALILNGLIWFMVGLIIKNSMMILQDINVLWALAAPLVYTALTRRDRKLLTDLQDFINLQGNMIANNTEIFEQDDEDNYV